MKRYFNQENEYDAVKTDENCFDYKTKTKPKEINMKEGGEHMSYILFGKGLLKELNFNQALYILDDRNWNKTLEEFCEGFKNVKYDKKQILSILDYLRQYFDSDQFENDCKSISIDEVFKSLSNQFVMHNTNSDDEQQGQTIDTGRCLRSIIRQYNPDYI